MITYPIAKINLGLNIVSRRPDGYPDLYTVLNPVALHDALEIHPMDEGFPSSSPCDLKVSNISVLGPEQDNLVVKAYRLIASRYPLPRLHAHLYKGIPTQAGMGGGSSDCASMILLLNDMFHLGMTEEEMTGYAARLGADCPFFIVGRPAYAEGIGERLHPLPLDLSGWYLAIVRPDIPVSTKEAFSCVRPAVPEYNCCDIVLQPVETWRDRLVNDFERSVFPLHPELEHVKERLYGLGAVYAAMSGSGSSLFGLFRTPVSLEDHFPEHFHRLVRL